MSSSTASQNQQQILQANHSVEAPDYKWGGLHGGFTFALQMYPSQ